jgi:hypothetical protein
MINRASPGESVSLPPFALEIDFLKIRKPIRILGSPSSTLIVKNLIYIELDTPFAPTNLQFREVNFVHRGVRTPMIEIVGPFSSVDFTD